MRATNGYVWPASHRAGNNPSALPMGARLRLKASKDISGFHPGIQKVFRAFQRYGLIVADNGSDMYISGTFDPRWPNDILNPAFRSLTANDFEVIELGWRGDAGRMPTTRLGSTVLVHAGRGVCVAVVGCGRVRRGLPARSRLRDRTRQPARRINGQQHVDLGRWATGSILRAHPRHKPLRRRAGVERDTGDYLKRIGRRA